jgi:general secretion pathway protein F
MAAFEYTALNAEGRSRTGIVEADSARHARGLLRERQLTPLQLSPVDERRQSTNAAPGARRSRRLPVGEQALLLRQLATLNQAGLPLEEALGVVAEQSDSRRARRLMAGLRARILEGRSLGQALREIPGAFPALVPASVEAGEAAGQLGPVLLRLADYTESRQNLGQKVWLALLYPFLVAVVAIVVLSVLLAVVMPKVLSVFRDMDAELPAITEFLLGLSGLLSDYGFALLGVIMASVILLALAWRNEGLGRRLERLILALPLIGRLMSKSEAARLSRTLGLLVGSGVPVVDAMGSARAVIGMRSLRDVLDDARERVREGEELGRSLARSKRLDGLMIRMISAGEQAGKLDSMLERCADTLEDDVRTRLATLVGLMEPLMILLVAGMVLFIVLGIMTPILQFNQLFSG